MDRMSSSAMGRPCSIQEEEWASRSFIMLCYDSHAPHSFDLEMPICVDDEYLTPDDPEQPVEQPAGKPSLMSYFVWMLKLTQIQGLALRTVVRQPYSPC